MYRSVRAGCLFSFAYCLLDGFFGGPIAYCQLHFVFLPLSFCQLPIVNCILLLASGDPTLSTTCK
jgi:hypothetical protein